MKYLVAVSGGIDSVVLLDMLVGDKKHQLIVAHFDHGIREDSAADARFVAGLAAQYGLPFVTTREELGPNTSEDTARQRRYAFLEQQAVEHSATIVTAHHADDVIETIALNLLRGTGWRGVAVLDRGDIVRPLLHLRKRDIRSYATVHHLEWVEDSTNGGTVYLRNRLRRRIAQDLSDQQKQALLATWNWQRRLKQTIDEQLTQYLQTTGEYERYMFIQIDPIVAQEILRATIMSVVATSPTRPQLDRALLALKTARSGAVFELGNGVRLRFSTRTFIVEATERMVLL